MHRIVIIVVLALIPWGVATAQVSQIERDALIAFYNSTDGPHWTNSSNWLGAAGTECTWHGVGCSSGHVSSLVFDSNELSGSIPSEIGDLTSLTVLYLTNNHLNGSIPTEVGSLTNLQDLRLNHNELSGSIPSQLGFLTSLTVLSLFSNELTGSIPPQLGLLTNLTVASLGHNELSGSIPPEVGNLPNLQLLYLNNNQLSGSIPSQLGDLASLTSLYLAYNELSGSIPPQLGTLSSLTVLLAESNQLSGSIPPELGDLSALTGLRLNHNQLSGSIPPELADLSSLQNLYLSFNRLSGSIPPQLGSMSNLEYLYLASNQLSGDVPTELQDLSALQDVSGLDLGWNALHSEDAALIAFLNQKQTGGGDWQSRQTVAPENPVVDWIGDHTVWLSWDAVSYQSEPGGYEVFVSPVAASLWVSVGTTASKTVLEIPAAGLDAGGIYDIAVASYTLPHVFNQNTVTSDLGDHVMAATADTGCTMPVIDLEWGDPAILSLTSGYDSYTWSTGETGAAIEVDPNDPRYYWVTVTSSGPCQESAVILVGPLLFSDGFEWGDLGGWSSAVP